jgi:TonB family protein
VTRFSPVVLLIAFLLTCTIQVSSPHAQPADAGTPPQLISKVTLTYPQEAKEKRIEGKVWLALLIDTFGNVAEIKVDRSDNALLDQAAIEAMKSARFKPATYMGVPEKVWYQQALTFKLSANDTATTVLQLLKDSPPIPLVPLTELFTYPPDAMAAGIQGSVELEATVDTNGNVEKSEIIKSTLPGFEAAALHAMNKATFLPAIENGVKVKAIYKQTLNFILPSSSTGKVVGIDSTITAAPELLDDLPTIFSLKLEKPRYTTVRVLVGTDGVVHNVLALDKNVDAATLVTVLQVAYKLHFAPGLIQQRLGQMWTDVTFLIRPLK